MLPLNDRLSITFVLSFQSYPCLPQAAQTAYFRLAGNRCRIRSSRKISWFTESIIPARWEWYAVDPRAHLCVPAQATATMRPLAQHDGTSVGSAFNTINAAVERALASIRTMGHGRCKLRSGANQALHRFLALPLPAREYAVSVAFAAA
jgi:hypothetical protein